MPERIIPDYVKEYEQLLDEKDNLISKLATELDKVKQKLIDAGLMTKEEAGFLPLNSTSVYPAKKHLIDLDEDEMLCAGDDDYTQWDYEIQRITPVDPTIEVVLKEYYDEHAGLCE